MPGSFVDTNVLAYIASGDPARRRALFARMLDVWEDECPGTILYQPLETYGVRHLNADLRLA